MHPPPPPPEAPVVGPATWAVVLAGALTLAVAMGIGRFAFTPLLPLMMRDGQLDAAGGAELAAANYLGYLVGALSAGRLAGRPLRLVGLCLPGIALLTAATGLTQGPLAWGLLRAAAGVCSAWAMVGISSWSLTQLAQRGRGALGGLVFAGVGAGIWLAGTMAWLAPGASARALWLQLGVAALLLTLGVFVLLRHLPRPRPRPLPVPVPPARPVAGSNGPLPTGSWPLVVCYGVFGFGYILPATFLPAMARLLIDDPRRFGLVWPVFGLAAMASVLLSLRWIGRWQPRRAWAVCQTAMAAGVALPLLGHSAWAIGTAALLVGGTFVLATVIAMQLARTLAPLQPAPLLGRMTAGFALGQIGGPLGVWALADLHWRGWGAIEICSAAATLLLLGSAVWLWRGASSPHRRAPARVIKPGPPAAPGSRH